MQATRTEPHLRRHVQQLLDTGLLTWDVLCEHSSRYEPADDEPAPTADELPFEDTINAGLPLQRADTVRLSNRRCYSRDGLRRWAETFRERRVRPQFPDTKQDLARVDLLLLGFDDASIDALLRDKQSLEKVRRAADAGDAEANRVMRYEQSLAVAQQQQQHQQGRAWQALIEPVSANATQPWFRAADALPLAQPDDAKRALRGKPVGSFLVVWSSLPAPADAPSRGRLIVLSRADHVRSLPVRFEPARGYTVRTGNAPPAQQQFQPAYLSLRHLLLAQGVRWPRDAPPVAGYVHDASRSAAKRDALNRRLWFSPVGTYAVRPSSAAVGDTNAAPARFIVAFRDRDRIMEAPVAVHGGPVARGWAAPDDAVGYATLEDYLASVRPYEPNGALPSAPLSVS